MLYTDAMALEGLLLAKGEQWPGEVDTFSAKGLPAYQDNGITTVAGAGKYGNTLWPRGATTNLLAANVQTGTDTLGNTTGFSICQGNGAYGNTTSGASTITSSTAQSWQGSRSVLVAFAAGQYYALRINQAVSASTQYTFSCYIRTVSGAASISCNAVNQAGTTVTPYPATLFTATTTWQRLTYTFTTPSGTTAIDIRLTEWVDSSYTFYTDGCQLEVGPSASPYGTFAGVNLAYDISSQVARGCDAITLAGWARAPSGAGAVMAAISDTGLTNYLKLAAAGAVNMNVVGPAGSMAVTWATPNTFAHIAVVLAPPTTIAYLNGVQAATSTAVVASTFPLTSMARVWLGNFNGGNTWGGYVDELMFLPYAAPVAQILALASMTTTPPLQPVMAATGDLVDTSTITPLAVVASDVRATYLAASKGGAWQNNMATLEFLLSEV